MPRSRFATASHGTRPAATRLLAGLGLVALLGGMAWIVLTNGEGDVGGTATAPATTEAAPTTTPTAVKPRPPVKIVVAGVGAYDPEGDRSENSGDAGLATDGNPATAWKTERYHSTFSKSGVGLVLDAGKPVKATRLVVTTETPGYKAQIRVGSSPTGPFAAVSPVKATTARTVFALQPRSARYLMVWVTSMPPEQAAAVNEVAVTGPR